MGPTHQQSFCSKSLQAAGAEPSRPCKMAALALALQLQLQLHTHTRPGDQQPSPLTCTRCLARDRANTAVRRADNMIWAAVDGMVLADGDSDVPTRPSGCANGGRLTGCSTPEGRGQPTKDGPLLRNATG